jgi:hypothetical protein
MKSVASTKQNSYKIHNRYFSRVFPIPNLLKYEEIDTKLGLTFPASSSSIRAAAKPIFTKLTVSQITCRRALRNFTLIGKKELKVGAEFHIPPLKTI